MDTKLKYLFGIPIVTFGFPIIAKVISLFFYFQLWLAGFLFETQNWEGNDRMMYGVLAVAFSLLAIFVIVGALDDEKQHE